jgi:hypothetical protein
MVVCFCAYGLITQWPEAHTAISRLAIYPVIIATGAAAAGSGCMLLAWRALLADVGSPLGLPAATRVLCISQLGKYLPGAVWAFAAQVELASDHDVPRRRCATTVVTSTAVTLGVGLLVALVALALTSTAAAAHYWWALSVAPLILIGLYPPVLGRLMDKALALARRPPLERRPTTRGLAKAAVWTALGWLLWGTQAWLLLRDVTGKGFDVLLLSIGAYALAWCAGTMLIIFPGGIGPREIALIAALAPVVPRGPALVVAVVSRVLMTVSDLSWAGAGLLIGRHLARTAARAGLTGTPGLAGLTSTTDTTSPTAVPGISAEPVPAPALTSSTNGTAAPTARAPKATQVRPARKTRTRTGRPGRLDIVHPPADLHHTVRDRLADPDPVPD